MKKNAPEQKRTALQSRFEQAVINVIEYLAENWKHHRKFRHKQELLEKIGIPHNNYPAFKKGERNIPEDYWHKITDVLLKDFKVHPTYIHTRTGPMFLDAPWIVEEPEVAYTLEDYKNLLKARNSEIQRLRRDNKELKEKNALLQKLNEQLEKSGKKSGKKP